MGNICLTTSNFCGFQQLINRGRGGEWEKHSGTYLSLETGKRVKNGRCSGVTQFAQLIYPVGSHSRASCPQFSLLRKEINKSFKNTIPLIPKQTLKTEIWWFEMLISLLSIKGAQDG